MIIESDDVCPVVLAKVMNAWLNLEEGKEEEIVIRTSWQAVPQELEKWCKETNNVFLGVKSLDNKRLEVRIKLIKRK
ncbi:MAG: sulfurtransferase TusA family protein [Sulfolobaceae archaeon]|nr:sulfurtransferase TusA family protein [Sulfolobaceae archaeon]